MKNRFWNKIKQLYSTGAIHILLGTFITRFVQFFGTIFVVRILSKSEYGLVSYVENIYSYALIIAGFGLSNALLRYVVLSDGNKKKAYFHYVTRHSFYRDLVIALIIVVANFFIRYPEGFSGAKNWIPVIALLLPFQDLVNDGLFSFRALFKNKLYAYWSVLLSLVLILGRIIGANTAGVGGVLWSRVLINAVFAILLILVVARLFGNSKAEGLSKSEIKEMNAYSFQYMITNGLWAIFMLNDTLLLGALCTSADIVAEYKVAFVFPGGLSLFSTAIGMYIGPYFTKNEKNKLWVQRNYKRSVLLSALAVGAVAAVLVVIARPLIRVFYGAQYENIVGLMRVLLLASFLNSGLRYTTANLLAAMGKIRPNLIVSFVGMMIQIGLDIPLIIRFNAMGVAISSCIVYSIMTITLFIYFYKEYYLETTKETT